MSRLNPSASIAANPTLVGAVTTLVVLVAVFLAYNANNGLPFVPTRELKVDIASGSNLVRGNDIREGGFRVGVLEGLKPVVLPGGIAAAQLTLKLDKSIPPVPLDSKVKIRPRSALGLKYVELVRGRSRKVFGDGDVLPAAQTYVPVQFDDIYKTFTQRTRADSRRNLVGFGNALSGRGQDLGSTIEALPRLFGHLTPVAVNLADPRTGLARFFRALGRAARIVAPVANTNARVFTDLARTFNGFSRDPEALKSTIAKSPRTIDVSTVSLRAQRPFLEDTTRFSRDFAAATGDLRRSLPTVNSALEVGAPVLRRSVALNDELQGAMGALRDLTLAPGTDMALRALTATVGTLNPQLRFIGPYVTVCNSWNYFWTYLAEHLSEQDQFGYAERVLFNSTGQQDNSVGSSPAVVPANGEKYLPASAPRGAPEFFHGQAYTAAITDGGQADCENGQRGYPRRLAKFAPSRFQVVNDPHTPGAQGPTFAGRPRVPRGETFTREPQTGPQLTP